jgi:hypothetical protein
MHDSRQVSATDYVSSCPELCKVKVKLPDRRISAYKTRDIMR